MIPSISSKKFQWDLWIISHRFLEIAYCKKDPEMLTTSRTKDIVAKCFLNTAGCSRICHKSIFDLSLVNNMWDKEEALPRTKRNHRSMVSSGSRQFGASLARNEQEMCVQLKRGQEVKLWGILLLLFHPKTVFFSKSLRILWLLINSVYLQTAHELVIKIHYEAFSKLPFTAFKPIIFVYLRKKSSIWSEFSTFSLSTLTEKLMSDFFFTHIQPFKEK